MDQYKAAFKEEAHELLAELESTLLELEEVPDDQDLIGRAFRAMHTIKGSGAMFGFDDIAAFTHDVETVFDLVREGKIRITSALVDMTLSACDQIRRMVQGDATDDVRTEEIVGAFRQMLAETDALPEDSPAADGPVDKTEKAATYRVRFRPDKEIFTTGTNPLLLLDEIRTLGQCRVIAHTGGIPALDGLNPEDCYLYWDVILTSDCGVDAIRDVFIFVEDDCEVSIDVIDEDSASEDDADYKKLGEILLERGDVTVQDLKKALNEQKRLGQLLVAEELVDPDAVASALTEQQHVKQVRRQRQETASASSIRVSAEKLDALVDLVGELVTVQARLSRRCQQQEDLEFTAIAEEVERLTGELRDNTMDIRMLPIGTTFARFKRLVRDLSGELGKTVVLETQGGETELDKTVIERLNDPLVHLIRNCIDHGIELPEVRERMGKPAEGKVRLAAAHRGASVVITIEDDGAGLDPEAIRSKAVEKNLISPDADLSESEIFAQIFAPGFSTAEKVTDVSGRGVGMDVVKQSIEALRGSIDISSRKGMGSTITLKLPLTLAIIDGLLVELDAAFYVLPLSAVEECAELSREDIAKAKGRNITNVRGQIVPYISLREMFGIENKTPDIEHLVIAGLEGQRFGVVVDKVIGGHQTVIKTLGKAYKDAKGFSGATILADGTVALILDVHKLTEMARQEEAGTSKEILH